MQCISFLLFVIIRWSKRVGRRKTWVVPLQLMIGIMFMSLSSVIERTLYSESPNVPNKGWQSTCNSVGQTLGVHLALMFPYVFIYRNSVFLALNEPTFLSSIRGSVGPIVTLRQFCLFWGVVYILYTLYILFFVEEKEGRLSK